MFPKIKIKNEIISKENSFISISSSSSSNNIINNVKENDQDELIKNTNNKNISKTLDTTKNKINVKLISNNDYNNSLLSIYIFNYPSLKEMKKALSDYCLLNNIYLNSNKKIIITPLLNNSIRIDFPYEKIIKGFTSYLYLLKHDNISFKNIVIKKDILISNSRFIVLPNNFSLPNINNKNYDNKLKSVINNKKKINNKKYSKNNKA